MIQHATLMDVFNAAGRAASPFLQADTERLKEKNDLELNSNAAVFRTELQNKIRDTNYDGDYDRYMGELNKFTNEQYDRYKARNTSPYYQKMLQQMRAQSLEAVRNLALVKEDEWRIDQADIRFQSNMEKHMELPPELALRAISNEVDAWKSVRPVSAKEEHAARQKYETAYYQKFAANALGNVKDVKALDKAMEDVRGAFASHATRVPVLDEKGNVTGTEERAWGFDGRKEWEDKLLEFEKNRIYRERIEGARTDAARADELDKQAVETGNFMLAQQAEAIRGPYLRGSVKEIMNGTARDRQRFAVNYDEKDHPELIRLFSKHAAKSGSGSGGKSRTDYEREMERIREELQKIGTLRQDDNITYERSFQILNDEFVRLVREASEGLGIGTADAELLLRPKADLEFYMAEIKNVVKKINPEFDTNVLNKISSIVTQVDRNKKLTGEQKDALERQVGRELLNTVADLGIDHLTAEQWVEKTRGIVTRAAGGQIALMDIKNKDAVKDMNLEKHIKIIEQAHENPDMIGSYNNEIHYIGNEENYKEWQKFTERDVATVLGIDRGLAEATGWANEEGRKDDVKAIPIITVKGAGDKDGTYKQDVVIEKDNKGKETKKIATLKRNDKTGKWEEVSRLSGDQSVKERDQQAQEKQWDIKHKSGISNLADEILKSSSLSARKEAFRRAYAQDYSKNVWAGEGTKTWERNIRGKQFLADELLMRGIDPETMEPIVEISQQRFDELKKRNPDQWDRIKGLEAKVKDPRAGDRGSGVR